MFYVFYGEDEYSLRQAVDELKAKLGDRTTVDLNTTILDGRSLSLDEMRMACDTLPFLADRRLVMEGLLARYEPRGGEVARGRADPLEAGLRSYLPTMPDTARLFFIEHGALSEKNPLLRMARELGGIVREFKPPTGTALGDWIERQVRAGGGDISPRATETLAAFVGSNLRQLAHEIEKLIAYAAGRTIQEADVYLLVADTREIRVWTLTDAIAARQRDQAIGLLHQLLDDGEQPPVLMAIITRQFRSLVQVKEMADQHLTSDAIATQLRLHSYVVQKAVATARSFTYERLEAIYRRLLDTDLAVKTGRLDPALALDLLIVELTGT